MHWLNSRWSNAPALPFGLAILGLLVLPLMAGAEQPAPERTLFSEPEIVPYDGDPPRLLPVGERLEYQIKWSFFHVADTSAEILPLQRVEGEPAYHVRMESRTNGFADSLYRVRDEIDSFLSVDVGKSLYYRKIQEGSDKRDTRIIFAWPEKLAQRTDYGQPYIEDVALEQSVFDPLGITYAFRMLKFGEDEEILIYSTDGRKLVPVEIKIHGREVVKTPLGRFECFLVEPDTKGLSGVFRKAPNARIYMWFHVEAPHIPVRLKSELSVGAFDSRLSGISGPDADAFLRTEVRGRY